MNYDQYLPENIKEMLPSTWHSDDDLTSLIGKTGYVPPDASLLVDAVTALAMGKNVLLKGPTGSGKTKFGEALSYIRSEEHTSELQSRFDLVCSLLLDIKKI